MSEEKKSHWERYLNKTVAIQLRHQPYIGITGEELIPATNDEGFMNTPLLRGKVVEVSAERIVVETTDPNPEMPQNKVLIDLDADRDVGFLTVIERSLIAAAG